MKSSSSKVARRYAKALVLLCDERGDGAAVRSQLNSLVAVLAKTPDVLGFLANPTVALEARNKILCNLLDQISAAGSARNLALLLLDKGRIAEVAGIVGEFSAMLDQRTGRVQAELVSAVAVAEASQVRLQQLLARILGKDVVLSARVDSHLIGGLMIRVGNTVYDATIANHLHRLRLRLVTD